MNWHSNKHFVLTVISIVQLVPVSGQFNCTQWRKLNAYDNIYHLGCTSKLKWDAILDKGGFQM